MAIQQNQGSKQERGLSMAPVKRPEPQISTETALKLIAEKAPEAYALIKGIVQKDVAYLGIDEVFVLRDKEGDVKAFKQACRLSVDNGGLVSIPVGGGTPIISAQGYEIWAEKAGASVIYPTEVMVFGQPQPNPSPLKDPASGEWIGWVVRAAAFRLSSMGIPQVSDRTVIFDINNHKHIDFLAKAKKYKQAFRILAKNSRPPEGDDGTWIEYAFDKSSSLWVNASHEEALDWYSEISQMVKNSLQLAQTHAARNSLKHLSGLQKSPGKRPVWDIPVIAWRPTSGSLIKWDPTTYKALQKKVSGLIDGDRSEFKQIELTSGVDHLGEDDIAAVQAGEVDETTPAEGSEAEQSGNGAGAAEATETIDAGEAANGQSERTEEDVKVLKNLAVTRKMFAGEYAAACRAIGIAAETEITDIDIAKLVMKKVNSIVDSADGGK